MDSDNNRQFLLLPRDRIAKMWPILSYYIEEALTPMSKGHEARSGNLLKAALSDILGCWVGLNKGGMVLVITTAVAVDPITGDKNLYIYTLTTVRDVAAGDLKYAIGKLQEFARSRGCTGITTITSVESVRKIFERLGGHSFHTMYMEV